jgi:uncharacterized protein YvpB
MSSYFLIPVFAFIAALLWWKPWIRRGIWTSGLFALPFLLIQPLLGRDVSLTPVGLGHLFTSTSWVFAVGGLAGAFYVFFLHHRLTPVMHPLRVLLRWLGIGPVVAVLVLFATHQSLLVSSLVGLVVEAMLILLLCKQLIWDTLTAMVGMALLYLVIYLFFGQMLHVQGISSGLMFLGYPLEDIFRILAFGALWGPAYAGTRILSSAETPFLPQHHVPKQVVVVASVAILFVSITWINIQFITVPKVIAATPTANQTLDSLASPITIQLDKPLDRASVGLLITPQIEGDVSFEDSYLQRTFVRRIVFTPKTYFQPETTYKVEVTSLKNVLGQKVGEYSYEFHTPSLPGVAETVPTDGQKDVPICDPFSVTLSQPVSQLTDLTFQLEPQIALEATPSEDKKSYVLKPSECLAQSQGYTLSVLRRLQVQAEDGSLISTEDPTVIGKIQFTTKGAPGITTVTPQGSNVLISTKELTVQFTEPMVESDLGAAWSVSAPGSWRWQDAQTAVYTFANSLAYETEYGLELIQPLKDEKGGFLPAGASFSFTTLGHVRVSSVSPRAGAGGVRVGTPITITFDQPVDHASAESNFSLTPTAPGSFSWSDRSMTFSTTLERDTGYTVSAAPGVHSLIGLDLANNFSSSFQTEESVTQLNIPVYYQQHALSCELASLKMALNFKSVGVSEDSLWDQIPKETAARDGNTWFDPDQVFVGDVNGQQNSTGYGVHVGPILQLASGYRSARSATGWSMQQLAQSLADGNPVEVWGVAGSGKADSWTTPGGRQVNTVVGEHARLLVGFTGKVSHPTSFIINDPIFGRLKWSVSQFRANWAALGNMGVAIL